MKKLLLLLILSTFITIGIKAQNFGSVDTTFNSGDFGFGLGDGASSSVFSTSIQNDGKIIIAGFIKSYNGKDHNGLARLNGDGSLDTSFNVGAGTANKSVLATAIQDDGKIIIGGIFTSYNDNLVSRLVRLNSDGSIDLSFNIGSGFDNYVHALAIQDDGKILIGGNFNTYDGNSASRIVRLNIDGSVDSTFNIGNGFSNKVNAISIQDDGKILIGGEFTYYNGNSASRIVRLNSDGSIDTTFNIGSGLNNVVKAIKIQDDGKILVGGLFTSYNGISSSKILRINNNGSIDNTFNNNATDIKKVNSIVIQNNDKIIIAGGEIIGTAGENTPRITRLNSDGNIDTSYNVGTGFNTQVHSISLLADGKVIAGGSFYKYNNYTAPKIIRLNDDGSFDNEFNIGTGFNDTVYKVVIQDDGKILVGGRFTEYNNEIINYLIRLNSDGSIDTSFIADTVINTSISQIVLQNDGKILVNGYWLANYPNYTSKIIRLNSDGSLDTTFNSGTGANYSIDGIILQNDGKILINGKFTSYNDMLSPGIVRLNNDGNIDTTFAVGTGPNYNILSMVLQEDGKVLIGGAFTSYNSVSRSKIARLNSDGSLDTSFNVLFNIMENINTIAIQENGKILIGGGSYGLNESTLFTRLNNDGTLDETFNIGTGPNSPLSIITIQDNGSILIGGGFTTYNDISASGFVHLNSDGSLETLFNNSNDFNYVHSIAIQEDEKIIIGGYFNNINGIGRNRIARVEVSSSLSTIDFNTKEIIFYPNPTKTKFTIQLENTTELQNVNIYNNLGQYVLSSKKSIIDTSKLVSGLYIVEIETNKGKGSKKLIIE